MFKSFSFYYSSYTSSLQEILLNYFDELNMVDNIIGFIILDKDRSKDSICRYLSGKCNRPINIMDSDMCVKESDMYEILFNLPAIHFGIKSNIDFINFLINSTKSDIYRENYNDLILNYKNHQIKIKLNQKIYLGFYLYGYAIFTDNIISFNCSHYNNIILNDIFNLNSAYANYKTHDFVINEVKKIIDSSL